MTELADFLLARIAEDEAVAIATRDDHDPLDWTVPNDGLPAVGIDGPVDGPSGYTAIVFDPARVLAECEAKRRIVERWAALDGVDDQGWADVDGFELYPGLGFALRILALPYAAHPDFREEWRP